MIVNGYEVLVLMDEEVKLLKNALALLKGINAQQFNSPRGLYAEDTQGNSLDDLFSDLDDAASDVYICNVADDDDDESDFYYEDEDEEEE